MRKLIFIICLIAFAQFIAGIGCVSSPPSQNSGVAKKVPKGPVPPDVEEFHGGGDGIDYCEFNWRPAKGAERYHFYQLTEGGGDWRRIGIIYPRKDDDWCHIYIKNLEPAANYYFKVTSVNENGESRGSIHNFQTRGNIESTRKDYVDILNPDNTPETAFLLPERNHINFYRTINPEGDEDYMAFKGKRGVVYGIIASKISSLDVYYDNLIIMSLHDQDMREMETRQNDAFRFSNWTGFVEIEKWECPADGLYIVKIRLHPGDEDGLARYCFRMWIDERE